ncbi:unnamed protein product [Jaminaea pallidilutea]
MPDFTAELDDIFGGKGGASPALSSPLTSAPPSASPPASAFSIMPHKDSSESRAASSFKSSTVEPQRDFQHSQSMPAFASPQTPSLPLRSVGSAFEVDQELLADADLPFGLTPTSAELLRYVPFSAYSPKRGDGWIWLLRVTTVDAAKLSMSRPGVRKMHTEHASAPHRGGSGADVLNGRRLVHPQGHHIYGATLDWRLRPANGDRGPEPSSSQSAPIMQSSTFSTPSWTGSPHDQLWSHGSVTYGSYYNGGSHMPQGTMAHSDEASTTFHQASHYGAGVLHTSDAHNFPLPHTSPIGLGLSLGGSDYNVPANQFAAAVPASRSNNTNQQQPHSHLFSPTGNGAGQQPQIVGYQQQTERGHVTSRSNEPHEPPLDAHTATSASAQVCGLRTAASTE